MRKAFALILLIMLMFTLSRASGQVYLVYGKVIDEEGSPVKDALVEVYSNDKVVTVAKTDQNGEFSLRIPEGLYTVKISKVGYKTLKVELKMTRERAGSIGTFILKPALVVLPETSYIEVLQGDSVQIKIDIKNLGEYPLNVFFNLTLPKKWIGYIKSSTGLTVKNLVLKAGENASVWLNVRISNGALGKYTGNLTISWTNFTKKLSIEFEVKKRDWRFLETPYTELDAYPGKTFNIPVKVTNTLDQDTSIRVSVDAPSGWLTEIIDETGLTINSIYLKRGESKTVFLKIHIPLNYSLSLATLTIRAQTSDADSELTVKVNVESRFDLVELQLPITEVKGVSGGNITIPFKVRNIGSLPSTFVLSYTCNVKGIDVIFQDSRGKIVDKITLNPDETQEIFVVAEIPPEVNVGSFYLTISARGKYSYAEANIKVNVVGRKTYEIETPNLMVSLSPGSTAVFRLVIRNTGNIAITSLRVIPYDIPEGFGVEVLQKNFSLSPGEVKTVSLKIKASDKTIEGFYNVPLKIVGDGIKKYRILVVQVQMESGLSYILFAIAIIAVSFALTLYSRHVGK